ncbi:MAG: DUF4350 domain-containing protein [Candidatus Binatia bacterium]
MLTSRNVIISVFIIVLLSVLGMIIHLVQPPDSGGMGEDSYGTRAYGQRALYELLQELAIPVERGLVPPSEVVHREVTLLFLKPDPRVIRAEPEYLRRVGHWIQTGGNVVIAPAKAVLSKKNSGTSHRSNPVFETSFALKELGLSKVSLEIIPQGGQDPGRVSRGVHKKHFANGTEKERLWSWRLPHRRLPVMRTISVEADGDLAYFENGVTSLRLPRAELQIVSSAAISGASGRIFRRTPKGAEHTLLALYHLGKGQVVVVSDPAILTNLSIAEADNSVLVAHLLARFGRPVVFDEFYHGLTIRGNPFWLATRYPYGLFVGLLVMVSGLWAWRNAIYLGPPLGERLTRRRTLREYVEAMANVFQRADCGAFVLRELRNGALWALGCSMHLSPKEANVEAVARSMSRKRPEDAAQLLGAVAEIDALLKGGRRRLKERAVVRAVKRLTQCL